MINQRILNIKRIQLHERVENREVFKWVMLAFIMGCAGYYVMVKFIIWYSMNYYFVGR